MNSSLSLLGRFAVITIGYGLAILAAGFMLNALILAAFGILPDPVNNGYNSGFWPSLLVSSPFMGLIIGYFAFWPALVMIIAGEYFNKRDSLFYSLCGLAIGIVLCIAGYQTGMENSDETIVLMSMAAAGITGGFVYWLVAGRWTNITYQNKMPEA
ncbi:hypothetical protein [Pseudochrobactrum sp. MP213Fo]|uniref:hypothetical protein n=1 Tax=Pseudochrobactrum sp. MP213Fo TaxID=3022250 RepID=UPI003B9E7494